MAPLCELAVAEIESDELAVLKAALEGPVGGTAEGCALELEAGDVEELVEVGVVEEVGDVESEDVGINDEEISVDVEGAAPEVSEEAANGEGPPKDVDVLESTAEVELPGIDVVRVELIAEDLLAEDEAESVPDDEAADADAAEVETFEEDCVVEDAAASLELAGAAVAELIALLSEVEGAGRELLDSLSDNDDAEDGGRVEGEETKDEDEAAVLACAVK